MTPAPWGAWLAAAANLGIAPAAFWRLSLREWRWLTGPGRLGAMTGAELAALSQRFPDVHHDRSRQS